VIEMQAAQPANALGDAATMALNLKMRVNRGKSRVARFLAEFLRAFNGVSEFQWGPAGFRRKAPWTTGDVDAPPIRLAGKPE